ncbi:phosphotransacetylase family protein [Candidatus Oscillochloris fontis]|uniref:phosphotransacetylase family protein n=1 Tax=Candidatus Oscillochloris fontis TaxID=2496868 RepID=UPI00101DDAC5|nr:phosphotransacetylase family protein [Candidatus Oscillochloris fontis]
MATLYVASTETFVGKSAVCMGLLRRMQRDGFNVGYMKPVSVSVAHRADQVLDEDAAFIRETLGLSAPLDQIAPVLITPGVIDSIMRGQPNNFAKTLRDAYLSVSRDKDAMVLEGTNTWSEGALVDLSADQVTDLLHAPGLLVSRYNTSLAVDTILSVQRYVGDRLIGVLLNQVEDPQRDFVQSRVVPFLESRGIPVFGLLPHDSTLAGVTVEELIEHLGGQLIGKREWCHKMVDSLMIGAMGAEASLSFFRRRSNKVVITGGDRSDLQLAALETSTNALVLTGNIRPAYQVMDRAEERQVPIIIVPDDTLVTVDRAESLFGRVRFHQASKLSHFINLMENHFDFGRLYEALGMAVG